MYKGRKVRPDAHALENAQRMGQRSFRLSRRGDLNVSADGSAVVAASLSPKMKRIKEEHAAVEDAAGLAQLHAAETKKVRENERAFEVLASDTPAERAEAEWKARRAEQIGAKKASETPATRMRTIIGPSEVQRERYPRSHTFAGDAGDDEDEDKPSLVHTSSFSHPHHLVHSDRAKKRRSVLDLVRSRVGALSPESVQAVQQEEDEGMNLCQMVRSAFSMEKAEIWKTRSDLDLQRSLYVFSVDSQFRRWMIKLAQSSFLETVVLLLIVINCIFLAIDDDPPSESFKGQLLYYSELVFTTLFSLELVIKVVAVGFINAGPLSYMRDWWNVLDFLVVFFAWLSFVDGVASVTILRTFRLLRPLRAVQRVPGLRIMITALLAAIPSLIDVMALLLFVLFIFGIVGMQLFAGKLRYRCYDLSTGDWADSGDLCSPASSSVGNKCLSTEFCADTGGNPNWGVTGFDNILVSWLTIIQSISLEGWSDIMYMVSDTQSRWSSLYFVVLILVGSLFVINLVIAVIFIRFDETKQIEEQKLEEQKRLRLKREQESRMAMRVKAAAAAPEPDVSGSEFSQSSNAAEHDAVDEQHGAARPPQLGALRKQHRSAGDEPAEPAPLDELKPRSPVEARLHAMHAHAVHGSSAGSGMGSGGGGSAERPESPSLAVEASAGAARKVPVVAAVAHGAELVRKTRTLPANFSVDHMPQLMQPANGEDESRHVLVHSTIKRWSELNWVERKIIVPCRDLVVMIEFRLVVIVAIIVNTILMGTEHEGMSETWTDVLFWSNVVLTQLFALEMVLMLIGLGWQRYVKDPFNRFDGLIVLVSELELILAGGGSISILRAFRLLRVLKLVRHFESLHRLLGAVILSMRDLIYFSLVLLLFMFIYSILGMQLFGGKFVFERVRARAHFDNFLWSFLTVFQILTGENWNEVMYDGVRAAGWGAPIYFVSLFIVGNYVVLSLFLAILLGNFDADQEADSDDLTESKWDVFAKRYRCCRMFVSNSNEDEADGEASEEVEEGEESDVRARPPQVIKMRATPSIDSRAPLMDQPEEDESVSGSGSGSGSGSESEVEDDPDEDETKEDKTTPTRPAPRPSPVDTRSNFTSASFKSAATMSRFTPSMRGEDDGSKFFLDLHSRSRSEHADKYMPSRHSQAKAKATHPPELSGMALFILPPHSQFRRWMRDVVSHPAFDSSVFALIFVAAVLLSIDTPERDLSGDNSGTSLAQFVFWGDLVVTILFTVEMFCKWIAFGVFTTGNGYMRSGWNVLDFVIVVVSWLDVAVGNLAFFKGFRALRALRPLRLVSRLESMRVIISSIFAAVPALTNVLVIALLFFLIFAILGVQSFMGRLKRCEDIETGEVLPLNQDQCDASAANVQWVNPDWHFDNIFAALLTLFQVATLEQWPDIMHNCLDSTPAGQAPERDHSWLAAVYFVLFITVCSFFILSLFVGVVVDEYNKKHAKFTGSEQLSTWHLLWLDAYKEIVYCQPPPALHPPKQRVFRCGAQIVPADTADSGLNVSGGDEGARPDHLAHLVQQAKEGKQWRGLELEARAAVFKVVTSDGFDLFIMLMIMLNIIVMSLDYYGAPDEYRFALTVTNLCFTGLFVGEMLLKWTGLGIVQYFSDNWNRFDASIVFISLATLIIESQSADLEIDPTVFRVFRILRIFRLIKRAKGLRQLIRTLIFSLPALYNIGLVLLLLYFIYACAGMALFGDVRFGEHLNEHANFRTLRISLLTLYRMSTGESWNGLMIDCQVQPPHCTDGEDCGHPWLAVLYFVSFVIVSAFLMLNVFVAVVLKNFEVEVAKDPSSSLNRSPVKRSDIEAFAKLWSKMCPNSKFMDVMDLHNFINDLEEPLGFSSKKDKKYRRPVARGLKQRELRVANRIPLDDSVGGVPLRQRKSSLESIVLPSSTLESGEAQPPPRPVRIYGADFIRFLDSLDDLPICENGQVHHLDVCCALAERVFLECNGLVSEEGTRQQAHLAKQAAAYAGMEAGFEPPSRLVNAIPDDNEMLQCIKAEVLRQHPEMRKRAFYRYRAVEYYAAQRIQMAWFRYRTKKNIVWRRTHRQDRPTPTLPGQVTTSPGGFGAPPGVPLSAEADREEEVSYGSMESLSETSIKDRLQHHVSEFLFLSPPPPKVQDEAVQRDATPRAKVYQASEEEEEEEEVQVGGEVAVSRNPSVSPKLPRPSPSPHAASGEGISGGPLPPISPDMLQALSEKPKKKSAFSPPIRVSDRPPSEDVVMPRSVRHRSLSPETSDSDETVTPRRRRRRTPRRRRNKRKPRRQRGSGQFSGGDDHASGGVSGVGAVGPLEVDPQIRSVLEMLSMHEWIPAFSREKIKLEDLPLLCEPEQANSLSALVPQMGPRIRLQNWVKKNAAVLQRDMEPFTPGDDRSSSNKQG